jgi:hypothetical protein
MNDFDNKWQRCVARARQSPPRDDAAPFGFDTRVLAAGQLPAEPALERAWERLALGWLACVVAGLAVCAVLELPHLRDSHPLNPGVENTVAQILWRL